MLVNTEFTLARIEQTKKEVYYAYGGLDPVVTEQRWDGVSEQPTEKEVYELWGKMLIEIKRWGYRNKGCEFEWLRERDGDISIDEFIGKHVKDRASMKQVGKAFRLGKMFENTEKSVKSKPKKKNSGRSNRWHFEKFKKKVRKKAEWTQSEEHIYQQALAECREKMLEFQQLFTIAEYNTEFGNLKAAASPGPDHVIKSMFPATEKNRKKLLWLINDLIFKRDSIPQKFKETRLIFVDKVPVQIKKRPVCIGQKIMCLMDNLEGSRLQLEVDKSPTYKNCYGFRKELSVEEYAGSLVTKAHEWKKLGMFVGMFQLDVSDAYTSVPHKRAVLAIYDLIKSTESEDKNRAWHLVLFTVNWLSARCVYFQKTCVIMESGVIQGGPFSPPVFLVYLSYTSKDKKRCLVMKFADDCGLLLNSPTPEGLRDLAKNTLADFSSWLKSKGMSCAEHKSKFMLMFRKKERKKSRETTIAYSMSSCKS